MLCKIADLFVDIPEAGGVAPRYRDYLWDKSPDDDVFYIKEEYYLPQEWPFASYEDMCFAEAGAQFHSKLIDKDGMMLHAAAVGWKGRAYLFTGPSGTGKSTHRKMWQQLYGESAVTAFNDDKPPLRFLDGRWYAYGAPWCGKTGTQKNLKFPLAGICFLTQGNQDKIRRLLPIEIIKYLTGQTIYLDLSRERALSLLTSMERLIQHIPVFLMECTPTENAARLSSETMSHAADMAGL